MADDTTDDLLNEANDQQANDNQSVTGDQLPADVSTADTNPHTDDQPVDPVAGQSDTQATQPSQLSGDPGTPFQPAGDPTANLPDSHPATDNQSNTDTQEAYDAGVPTAAGAEEPGDTGVAGYSPPSQPEPAPTPEDNDADEPTAAT